MKKWDSGTLKCQNGRGIGWQTKAPAPQRRFSLFSESNYRLNRGGAARRHETGNQAYGGHHQHGGGVDLRIGGAGSIQEMPDDARVGAISLDPGDLDQARAIAAEIVAELKT
jgi:hypothetical protein